jgi:hypothetical protein
MKMRLLALACLLAAPLGSAWAARQQNYTATHRPGGFVEIVLQLYADGDAVSESKRMELDNMLNRAADRECPGGHDLVVTTPQLRQSGEKPVAELRAEGTCKP